MIPVLERLRRELERQRQADAYLLLGRSRPDLRRTALEAAALLLGSQGPAEEHPDCAVFDPDALGGAGLKVEHIAERKEGVPSVEGALRFRPIAGDRRCLVLFEADRMGPDAQAALLKTAEEPPPGTFLLLTATDLSPLLPALRSRCRVCRVPAPPRAETDRRAAAAGIEDGDWLVLQQACGGPEPALDLDRDSRADLLAVHASFRQWLAGERTEGAWLAPPEGGTLAEQREAGRRRLAALLGWIAAAFPEQSEEGALLLDRLGRWICDALIELEGMVTPAVLFEDLGRNFLEGVVAP
ncbi:MAG: hypothetical protein D6702_05780 [Planctomycetota bacterium]|nr:MAG: hypothetical protein D6702_05780 [Planctomycetota bacterium]